MDKADWQDVIASATPVFLAYIVIGLAAGILGSLVGLKPIHVFLLSFFVYTGAGQFMLPSMLLAGVSMPVTLLSIVLVNSRQMLYASALAPYFKNAPAWLKIFGSLNVTDESFGIEATRFAKGDWSPRKTLALNTTCQSGWILGNVTGCAFAGLLCVPTAIAGFAMTSIFICLLFARIFTNQEIVVSIAAALGVVLLKLIGLTEVAIFGGAILGVISGVIYLNVRKKRDLV